ncbi:MAG TPA: hypothetical protein VGN33_05115 [Leifsonia sp.]|jgi:quercetin dioxygenase-like cupin family protein|nr:hypothetical protein [Leifsonia sp.]
MTTTLGNFESLLELSGGEDQIAVRSSQVLERPGVRIVVLAFRDGASLREHTVPTPILLHALDGRFTVHADRVEYDLYPGNVLHLDAGVSHTVHTASAARLSITFLG